MYKINLYISLNGIRQKKTWKTQCIQALTSKIVLCCKKKKKKSAHQILTIKLYQIPLPNLEV